MVTLAYSILLALSLSSPDSWFSRFLRLPIMRKAGELSYAIYLLHCMVLWIVSLALKHLGLTTSHPLLCVSTSLVLTVGLANLTRWSFEIRCIRYGHRFNYA